MTEQLANPIRFSKHTNRKNNDVVAAMYAMYLKGEDGEPKSLAEVGAVYKRSRQAVYDVFKVRGYKLRSKKFKPVVVLDGVRFTTNAQGYFRSTKGKRKLMHIFVWEKYNGRLPKKHGIHHKDLDRSNNKISNLECLSIEEISTLTYHH